MKKIFLYMIAACCLNLTSCSFLEETSQDEVRPGSVEDLVQLMLGEGYTLDYDFNDYFDLLGDDVVSKCPAQTDVNNVKLLDQYKAIYLWDSRMYDICKEKQVDEYNHWEYLYKRIMGCNVILSMIDKVPGEHNARENLRGQALAMRGFYFFMLVNIYSMPYTSGNPDELAGIPIVLEPQYASSFPPREKLSTVYAQIISDLTTAYPLLNKYGQNNLIYRATDKFANAVLSRVYLYMGEWKESIKYATYVIDNYPSLQKLSNHIESIPDPWGIFPPTIMPNHLFNVYSRNSSERIWGYASSSKSSSLYIGAPFMSQGSPAWLISNELVSLYRNDPSGATDCRLDFYLVKSLDMGTLSPLFMDKGEDGNGPTNSPSQGVRTAEMYLNRAEANIMLAIEGKGGDIAQALSDLNTLRESRFNTQEFAYTPWTTTDPKELFKMYEEERRRELAFERHRWFDLRRWGRTGFSHTIEVTKGQPETVVFDNPKKYALPIPQDALDRNPSIKQNLY